MPVQRVLLLLPPVSPVLRARPVLLVLLVQLAQLVRLALQHRRQKRLHRPRAHLLRAHRPQRSLQRRQAMRWRAQPPSIASRSKPMQHAEPVMEPGILARSGAMRAGRHA